MDYTLLIKKLNQIQELNNLNLINIYIKSLLCALNNFFLEYFDTILLSIENISKILITKYSENSNFYDGCLAFFVILSYIGFIYYVIGWVDKSNYFYGYRLYYSFDIMWFSKDKSARDRARIEAYKEWHSECMFKIRRDQWARSHKFENYADYLEKKALREEALKAMELQRESEWYPTIKRNLNKFIHDIDLNSWKIFLYNGFISILILFIAWIIILFVWYFLDYAFKQNPHWYIKLNSCNTFAYLKKILIKLKSFFK